jgi:hypothetical protein
MSGILWALLVVALMSSMSALVLSTATASQDVKPLMDALRRQRPKLAVRAGVVMTLCAAVNVALWLWLAIEVGDWRFAAVSWVPFLGGLLGRLVRGKADG